EMRIVRDVDEELCAGGVGIRRARHGEGSAQVLEPVVGLVLDGRLGRLLAEVGGEAAGLKHEPGDDAVEDGPFVESLFDVVHEILHRVGRLVTIEFHDDVAFAGADQITRVCVAANRGGRGERQQQDGCGDEGSEHGDVVPYQVGRVGENGPSGKG